MPKAIIKTLTGAIITVEGTVPEVGQILSDFQRRERMLRHQSPFYRNEIEQVPFFPKRKIISPKEEVLELIGKGYFDQPHTLTEIKIEIQKKDGIVILTSSLHPTLISLMGQNKLIRSRSEEGLWLYQIKKEEKNGSRTD